MKKIFLLFLILCSTYSSTLQGQKLERVQGNILIRLLPEENLDNWVKNWQFFEGRATQLKVEEQVSIPLSIWLLSFDHTRINAYTFLDNIRKSPAVQAAQFNHLVNYRAVPNDPLFSSQWQYINTGLEGGEVDADLDIDEAWDISTGGLTANGDTIVICIIDTGVDAQHQDLQENLWVNHHEIPNNDIDDDNNGYVDDYRGWNTINTVPSDDIAGDPNHGTSVAGIIGAIGNNNVGISGINWNVKLMMVVNGLNTTEAKVIASYSYPLSLRKQYNETNGEKGAFVVATNSSWGLDFAQVDDAPLWCAIYDSLGTQGILNAGATANKIVDVDEDGDLPTSCPSDYLIAVTNMDRRNQKVQAAGWGATSIDLGAYGEDVFTLDAGNDYGPFRGTSAATPQVAGAIGLLYSAPCSDFMDIVKNAPATAALFVKRHLLEGVAPNESLEGLTLTEGVLNINNSMVEFMEECGTCPPSTNPTLTTLTDTLATLEWIDFDINTRTDLRWRATGSFEWNQISNATSPYVFPVLTACTSYEYQFQAFCLTDTLDYSTLTAFTTNGCCEPPIDINIPEVGVLTASLSWAPVLAADGYRLRYRIDDTANWDSVSTVNPALVLSNLMPCQTYEAQIQTLCDDTYTGFGSPFFFMTSGCGACLDLDYCVSDFLNSDNEWIERVQIGPLDNTSGSDPAAYGDYTGLAFTQLEQGNDYPLMLVPGYTGISYGEYFKVWIDYDQNGTFENDEVVYDPGSSTNTPLEGEISIAPDAPLGVTRMRVVMQFQTVTGTCPFSGQEFGEIEDYCVQIVPTNNCNIPVALDTVAVGNTMTRIAWNSVSPAVDYFLRYRIKGNSDWLAAVVSDTSYLLSNLIGCSEYEVSIKSRCDQVQSEYSSPLVFKTNCVSNVDNPQRELIDWDISPNPATDHFWVKIRMPELKGNMHLVLFDATGRRLQQFSLGKAVPSVKTLQIPVENRMPGLYFVQLVNNNIPLSIKKVIIQ